MKTVELPVILISKTAINKIKNCPNYYTSLLDQINGSQNNGNNLNKPKVKQYNDNNGNGHNNLFSLFFSPLNYIRSNRKNRFGYLVNDNKIPQISTIHSKIIKESLLKSQNSNQLTKDNSQLEEYEDKPHFEYPSIIKDPNRPYAEIEEKKEKESPLFYNCYKKKISADQNISGLITEELFKAKMTLLNRSRSQSTMMNNNYSKVNLDKMPKLNCIYTSNYNKKLNRNKPYKYIKHSKPTEWNFIDIKKTNRVNEKLIEISKYADPYKVIKNNNLMKKLYDETMTYIPFDL